MELRLRLSAALYHTHTPHTHAHTHTCTHTHARTPRDVRNRLMSFNGRRHRRAGSDRRRQHWIYLARKPRGGSLLVPIHPPSSGYDHGIVQGALVLTAVPGNSERKRPTEETVAMNRKRVIRGCRLGGPSDINWLASLVKLNVVNVYRPRFQRNRFFSCL